MKDVVIVGAGPGGMFAANELTDAGKSVLIIDEGKSIKNRRCPLIETGDCTPCSICDIMCGVGGAGTFSDGTLNLRPDIGGDLSNFTKNGEEAWKLVDYVDKIFLRYGAPEQLYKGSTEDIANLKRRAASVDVKFIDIKQRHIGSDKTPAVVGAFEDDLKRRGTEFLLSSRVSDLIVEDNECKGVIVNGEETRASSTIIAPGRVGASWANKIAKAHSIKSKYAAIDVGVRVEVQAIVMDPVTKINRDPKFHIRTETYDDFVRTFCTNDRGYVVNEGYKGFIGVNGHSLKEKQSDNTNFAFIVRVELTKPVENTTMYGKSIAKLATTIGGGKPIVQRMGDLRRGRRSNWERIMRNPVKNTLANVTPGDISMALPHRIVTDIIEGLEKLNEVIPGVASDSTLLYAPEIKFYAVQLEVNENMETSVKNLYAAGDGVGLSRGLVTAAATGVLAGRGVLKNLGQ
jgi:hypothetical protein